MIAQHFKAVAGSAVGCGAKWWHRRSSGRSFTGLVVVAGFASLEAAAQFARRWSQRCGVNCTVRRGSVTWLVSVPVLGGEE